MATQIEIAIEHGDITTVDADIVGLKYAQASYGADDLVARKLATVGVSSDSLQPPAWQYSYVESRGSIRAPHVVFVGVPSLYQLTYDGIRQFAQLTLSALQRVAPSVGHLAMTIHGPGFGLDEGESCVAQLGGYLIAIRVQQYPPNLRRITIVDRDEGRVARLRKLIASGTTNLELSGVSVTPRGFIIPVPVLPTQSPAAVAGAPTNLGSVAPPTATATKPHAFVAMSFSTHMNDIFYYGIQAPVNAAGFLCERMDHVSFAGEIIDWMKRKIETASVVIAELSGANPNVYLEVGYAWGKGRPTILVAPRVEELAFDVRGHRCLVYDGIRHLEDLLARELAELRAKNFIQ
jgi:hypothetical protein